ncbi:MAG: VWA domain-containing protein, partial [Planctomycetota bacterium]
MDWLNPYLVLVLPVAAGLVWWSGAKSLHPMSPGRRRALLVVRSLLVALMLLALAGPAWEEKTGDQAVIFVMDHSHSQGEVGQKRACERAKGLAGALPSGTYVGIVSAGTAPVVRAMPTRSRGELEPALEPDQGLAETGGAETNLADAVALAGGLFPPGTARRLVVVGDGVETRGSLERAAREAAVRDIVIDAVPVAGDPRPDVRVTALRSSRSRSHEGATISLSADVESSLAGEGAIRLFENGVEVESRKLKLALGERRTEVFRRTPDRRNLYSYRVRVEGFSGDAIPENNEALALIDVRGRPLLLYVEGEPGEAHYLSDAMAREGIRLELRPPEGIPEKLEDLAGYDGIVLSDVPAHKLASRAMTLVRDYVEHLGGGFLMIGGKSSFGVGGYYRTPIEDVLPVKMKAPDVEEHRSTALALVIDRSGSMSGQKIEICKSAAISTAELLSRKDYIAVVAFDSTATWIVPITRVTSQSTVASQIATINAGGGTNIYPGMVAAHEALRSANAKIKHMIVLSDGHSSGSGYQPLAAQMKQERITVSTVGVGAGADAALLSSIAGAGGGKFYQTTDPSNIPRIFTQDAMVHMGRLIREEAFRARQVERHPMLKGWAGGEAPELLGYVKTVRKATSQVPLVTDLNDPLLAHWRYGLGKVTAFTSDCKSRWASLWITGWPGYSQFWAQVLRETAREPQGRNMDVRLEEDGARARIVVDLMEDAAQFGNEADVEADVFFVPARSLGSAMRPLEAVALDQSGPGRYTGGFRPDEAGVYLVRARSGSDSVSAGLVHNVSGEAAAGRVNLRLLERVCEITGGKMLAPAEDRLPAGEG